MEKRCVLSTPALESFPDLNQVDRVTIYRSLDTFEKAGIIHKVPSEDHHQLYALSDLKQSSVDHDTSTSHHGHFYCEHCDTTVCLEESMQDELTLNLPDGFKSHEQTMYIKGICRDCNHEQDVMSDA